MNAVLLNSSLMSVSLLAIGIATAQAPDASDMPVRKVGDKWSYHETTDSPASERQWSRWITDVSTTGGYTTMGGNGVALTHDAAGNVIDRRGSEYSEQKWKFPISVGSKWAHDRKINSIWGMIGPQEVVEQATWEVKAFEKLSVPGGTFDCFRVSGVAYVLSGANSGHVTTTYWYCPNIRGVAKSEQVVQKYQGAPIVTTIYELVSFKEGPE
jgi:hypothetical protein